MTVFKNGYTIIPGTIVIVVIVVVISPFQLLLLVLEYTRMDEILSFHPLSKQLDVA